MAEVKGTAVKSIAEFIKAKFGDDKYNEWLNSLPEDAKKIFSGIIVSSSWQPMEAAYTVPLRKMCELFYNGDEAKGGWEAGRYSAESALTGVYKFFIKLGTPAFIIKKASSILPTYYKPSTMEIADLQSKSAVLRITSFEELSVMAENRMAGWIDAALELSGAKNPQVKITSSLAKGAEYTDFQMNWD